MTTSVVVKTSIWQIFFIFFKLGLTSFGGPIAHLGYFHQEFVLKRGWLSQQEYADLIALCQFLPGPTSSQVGMALGYRQGHYYGAGAAWLGFSLPSVVILVFCALALSHLGQAVSTGLIHGLKIVAVAVVVQAIWMMAKQLCPDPIRVSFMLFSCCSVLLFPALWMQVAIMIISALLGMYIFASKIDRSDSTIEVNVQLHFRSLINQSAFCLLLFVLLLIGLPIVLQFYPNSDLALFDAFYRSGALVFGGGHVVLPLLQTEVVQSGWLDADQFFAGYALAQAMPGPLFSFAAFVGAAMPVDLPVIAACIAVLAIFLPSFLLLFSVLPFWQVLSQMIWVRSALLAVNAAVVGILLAALYQPMWTSSILTPLDFCLALLFWVALMFWKIPVWLIVCVGAGIGFSFL